MSRPDSNDELVKVGNNLYQPLGTVRPVPLVERFYRALLSESSFSPTGPARMMADSTTPGRPGRMTVAQGLYHERRIPAMLMEQMICRNPKLGRFPTLGDRQTFGAGLVRAVAQALLPVSAAN